MLIKSVSAGEPIRASWANSIANTLNNIQGLDMSAKRGKSPNGIILPKTILDPAFHIRFSGGYWCLNAGQIYINGLLVGSKSETSSSSSSSNTSSNSYNQYSSMKNWDKNSTHKAQEYTDMPEWYVVITGPKVVTKANIGEVEAELIKQPKGTEAPKQPNQSSTPSNPDTETKPEEQEDKMWICIQLSKVENDRMIQLVSGSIYLSTPNVSLVGGDGICVTPNEDGSVQTIDLYVSFIAEDGIEITETYDPPEESKSDETTEGDATTQAETETNPNEPETKKDVKRKKVIKIKNTSIPLSFIGIDGITVHEDIYNYDVSTEQDQSNIWKQTKVITIEHDIKSFIGKDGISVSEETWKEEVKTNPDSDVTVTVEKKAIVISGVGNTLSFIGKDGITVSDKEAEKEITDPTTQQVTKEKVRLIEISSELIPMSFIGVDDIKVSEYTVNEDVSTEQDQSNIWKQKKVIVVENAIASFVGKDGITVSVETYSSEATDPVTGQAASVEKKAVIIANEETTKFSFIGEDGITILDEATKDTQGNNTVRKITIKCKPRDVYEFVGEDGVKVTDEVTEEQTETGETYNKHTVTIGASVIADVDVDIRGGNNVTVEKTTEGQTQVFTVSSKSGDEITIAEGDGISVTKSNNQYTISCTISAISYDFDPTWFTVTNNTVSINETKLDEVAQSLA